MRHILLILTLWGAGASSVAGAQAAPATQNAPDREALLRAAVARDRGDITAMEPSAVTGQGILIGYSSGAVLRCRGQDTCVEFGGTPNIPVEHIAVSLRGESDVVWVSYPRGALYRCIESICNRFVWNSLSAK